MLSSPVLLPCASYYPYRAVQVPTIFTPRQTREREREREMRERASKRERENKQARTQEREREQERERKRERKRERERERERQISFHKKISNYPKPSPTCLFTGCIMYPSSFVAKALNPILLNQHTLLTTLQWQASSTFWWEWQSFSYSHHMAARI